jgi:hypothetical protein
MPATRRLTSAAVALVLAATAAVAAPDEPSARELAVEALLDERGNHEALAATIAKARAAQVSEQAILEARFLYHVDADDDAALVAMLPEFRARRTLFVPEESEIFAVEDDWLAVVEFIEAIAALHAGAHDEFKKHITEAFWLSPRQATAFAPHIERLRLAEAMAKLRLDLTLPLQPQGAGPALTLAALVKDRKAIVLHFWSPLSRECEASMPDFVATSKELTAAGIPVVSILLGDHSDAKLLAAATALTAQAATESPAQWLRDHPQQPLARPLRIQQLPTMIVVAPDGRILFNGHPVDESLWTTLATLAPTLTRPSLRDGDSE